MKEYAKVDIFTISTGDGSEPSVEITTADGWSLRFGPQSAMCSRILLMLDNPEYRKVLSAQMYVWKMCTEALYDETAINEFCEMTQDYYGRIAELMKTEHSAMNDDGNGEETEQSVKE